VGKIYVVNDPHLIAAIQRQHRVITLQAIQDRFSSLICDLSSTATSIQQREATAWLAGPKHAPSPLTVTFKALGPGKYLDKMNRIMLQALQKVLDEAVLDRSEKSVGLFEWISGVITGPTTEGMYGPANPYRNATIREAYW
jgi:hypothetical protein